MGCRCTEKDRVDRPHLHPAVEFCPYCAEKHLSAAAALAREQGYSAENRAFVAGELVAAAWHLPEWHPFAERLREARHAVQARPAKPVDWGTLCREFSEWVDGYAAEEAARALDAEGADR